MAKGLDKHLARLNRLSKVGGARRMSRALFVAGDMVRVEAQRSITRGATSGRGHVPSAPGEAPNQDTGVLGANIETRQISPLVVEVSSEAPYAAALEFGTSKMVERPYMRPARDKKRDEIVRLLDREFGRFVRESG